MAKSKAGIKGGFINDDDFVDFMKISFFLGVFFGVLKFLKNGQGAENIILDWMLGLWKAPKTLVKGVQDFNKKLNDAFYEALDQKPTNEKKARDKMLKDSGLPQAEQDKIREQWGTGPTWGQQPGVPTWEGNNPSMVDRMPNATPEERMQVYVLEQIALLTKAIKAIDKQLKMNLPKKVKNALVNKRVKLIADRKGQYKALQEMTK